MTGGRSRSGRDAGNWVFFHVRMRCQASCETTYMPPPSRDAQSACHQFPATPTHTREKPQQPILCTMQAVGGVGNEVEAPSWQESGSVVLGYYWIILSGTVPRPKIRSIVSSSLSRFGSSFFPVNKPGHWKRRVLFARELLPSGYSFAETACGECATPSRWTKIFIG